MTPQEVAKKALGISWYDTESAARRVAETAAVIIQNQQKVIDAANELIKDLYAHEGAEGFSMTTKRLNEAYEITIKYAEKF